jgi:hypothetical protein
MKCKCGEQGELKVFNTFKYYYCNKCKAEIEEAKEDSKNDYDPFDPNSGSISDFYLDLGKAQGKALDRLADLYNIKRSDTVTITLPKPEKGMYFRIYRRCANDSFKELHIEEYHAQVSDDGKNWNMTVIEGK